jgi:ketosteroid isomerase-like protein
MINYEQQLQDTADRLAIRELIDQYAYCADSRDAKGQMALFTEDTLFLVYMDSKSDIPTQVIRNRADLFPVFDNLNTYHATMHFNGQNSLLKEDADRATGIAYCMAHHLTIADGKQQLMIAAIRYLDNYTKQNGKWLFAGRKLMVDWIENR